MVVHWCVSWFAAKDATKKEEKSKLIYDVQKNGLTSLRRRGINKIFIGS